MKSNVKANSIHFLVFLFTLQACVSGNSENWLSPPKEEVRLRESPSSWPQISSGDKLHISRCQKSKAMELLRSRKFVALNLNEVKRLTGKTEKRAGKYYLIRSLQFTDETAGFFLGWKNQQMWSHAGVLGSNPHLVKIPLIVRVKKPIKTLYITVDVLD